MPTTASVFVAHTSVSERRKGVRHQLYWLCWPVTAKLTIVAAVYTVSALSSSVALATQSHPPTYRHPTLWFHAYSQDAPAHDIAYCSQLVTFLGEQPGGHFES